MSWARGWYGWDPDSEDAAAWGPCETVEEARGHPDPFADPDAEVRVFYISVSETPPPRHFANECRQRTIWVDGPDSEAARACRNAALPVLRTPVIPGDPEADARVDEMMRQKEASRDLRPIGPDPSHTPAVRRVVALPDDVLEEIERDENLNDLQKWRAFVHLLGLRRRRCSDLRSDLNQYLRHRDEGAGCR